MSMKIPCCSRAYIPCPNNRGKISFSRLAGPSGICRRTARLNMYTPPLTRPGAWVSSLLSKPGDPIAAVHPNGPIAGCIFNFAHRNADKPTVFAMKADELAKVEFQE